MPWVFFPFVAQFACQNKEIAGQNRFFLKFNGKKSRRELSGGTGEKHLLSASCQKAGKFQNVIGKSGSFPLKGALIGIKSVLLLVLELVSPPGRG